MLCHFQHRGWHYVILLGAAAGLFLANLGLPSLWDRDEGRNATAALEMLKSGDYVVPHFNSELRVDKPALLYWLQATAYRILGIDEFSARLPSALAALATLFLCYELGRSLFGRTTALLAALMVGSTPLMCGAARFANPDALLHLFIVAMLFCFWQGQRGSVLWFAAMGIAAGLAVLAKGPVGLLLPGSAIAFYCCWMGQGRTLFRPAYFLAWAMCLMVALPWYIMVGVETKARFLTGFLLDHNVQRFLAPMENHHGSLLYYPAALLIGTAPWSVFWWLLCRPAQQAFTGQSDLFHKSEARDRSNALQRDPSLALEEVPSLALHASVAAYRFLASWLIMVVLFFSLSATKLPNYVLPALVPCGLLAAHQMVRWSRGEIQVPGWLMRLSLAAIVAIGLGVALGMLVVSGVFPIVRGRTYPGLERLAPLGLGPLVGGAVSYWLLCRGRRSAVVWSLTLTSLAFALPMAIWASSFMDPFKAPRSLIARTDAQRTEQPLNICCWNVAHLPSLNFYARRDLTHCDGSEQLLSHLRNPTPVCIILPAGEWETLKPLVHVPVKELGRQRDMLGNETIVIISNR